MSTGRRASPRHASVASQSHDSDEDMGVTASTKESRPLSRNAQAQARLRARRKAYVETLEANVKRLQTIVDAIALDPTRAPRTSSNDSSPLLQPPHGSIPREVPSLSLPAYISPPTTSSSESISSGSLPVDTVLHQLQADNARLRRERDALQIQINALTSYISRGYTLPPGMAHATTSNTPSSQGGDKMTEHSFSTGPGSDTGTESPGQPPDAAGASPLIHPGAYTQEDINQLLGYGDPNLAFLRYLQTTGSYGAGVPSANPESFAATSSAQATFQSLANSATSGNNVISGLQRDAGPNLGFSSTDR